MASTIQMSRRGFLAALGGTAALAGLSACALNSGSKPKTGPTNLDVEQTINVWDYDPTGIDLWVDADKKFGDYFTAKYPKVKVKRTTTGFQGFAEALLTSVAGGAKYDVIYGWSPWLPQFVKNNVVTPLDDYLKNDGDVSADAFYDYGKDMRGGKLYGLAWYASAEFMYYNRTALKNAGLGDPAQLDAAGQWTFDAFKQLAQAATKSTPNGPVYGFDMGITRGTGDFSAFSRASGSDLWDTDMKKSLADSPVNVALWTFIQDFYRQKLTPTPSEGSGLNKTLGFGNERIMMMISGANYFRQADQDKVASKFDIGLSRIPKGPGGQSHVSFLNSYYMGAHGDNANGAWAWYKERSFSPKAVELYVATGAGRFPDKKDQKAVTVYPFENAELFEQIRKDMYAVRVIDQEFKFEDLYGAAWDQLALKSGNAQQLLTKLASDANQLIGS